MHIDVKFRRADYYYFLSFFGVAMYQYHIPNAVHFLNVFLCVVRFVVVVVI